MLAALTLSVCEKFEYHSECRGWSKAPDTKRCAVLGPIFHARQHSWTAFSLAEPFFIVICTIFALWVLQAALAERNEELSFLKQTDARAHQLFELKELLDSAKELLNSVRSAFGGTQMSEQITDPKDVLSKIVSWMDWAQGHELEADDAPHAARDQYDI